MNVEIKWLGHACFAIRGGDYTIVIDPYNSDYTTGYPKLRVKADMLLVRAFRTQLPGGRGPLRAAGERLPVHHQ